jgi:hypothetical protein
MLAGSLLPLFTPHFRSFSFLARLWLLLLLLLPLPNNSSTAFASAFSVKDTMADGYTTSTDMNSGTGEDNEWAAVPKKKKNSRDCPHHKKAQGDEFPSFLDSIPSYIHPPPPPLPATTRGATANDDGDDDDDDVAGDVLGSVESSIDDLVMILLVGFPGT